MAKTVCWCDCDWFDGDFPDIDASGIADCGCGEHHARLYRDDVIHWEGKHWRLQCAFETAWERLCKDGK